MICCVVNLSFSSSHPDATLSDIGSMPCRGSMSVNCRHGRRARHRSETTNLAEEPSQHRARHTLWPLQVFGVSLPPKKGCGGLLCNGRWLSLSCRPLWFWLTSFGVRRPVRRGGGGLFFFCFGIMERFPAKSTGKAKLIGKFLICLALPTLFFLLTF